MELRHLRSLIAIAREGSITRAAEALHISQPPLSRQIQELEEEVGTPLLVRGGKGSALTAAGEVLLEAAERAVEGLEAACARAREAAAGAMVLRVGCVSPFLRDSVAPFLAAVKRLLPGRVAEFRVLPTEEQCRALLSGELDVGFARGWADIDGLRFEPLFEEEMVLVAPAAAARRKGGVAAAAEALPCIRLSREAAPGLAELAEEAVRAAGVEPRSFLECNDSRSAGELAAAGAGWAALPDSVIRGFPEGLVATARTGVKTRIGLCYREGEKSAEVAAAIEAARAAFAPGAPDGGR